MKSRSFHLLAWLVTIAALLPFALGSGGVGADGAWWRYAWSPLPPGVLVCIAGIVVLEILVVVISRRLSQVAEDGSERT